MIQIRRKSIGLAAAAAALVVSGFLTTSVNTTAASAKRATGPIRFGPTTLVDDQRLSGEPDIKVCGPNTTWSYGACGQNNPYASVPWGFSTTSSFIWRSEDRGGTFKLVPGNVATGKPTACPGGGDTDLLVSPGVTQSADHLAFEDLQALNNFSSGVSTDGGTTFTCSPVSAEATAVDRQWLGAYKPLGSAGSAVYMDYDIAAGSSLFPTCVTGVNSAGNLFVVQKSTDGGLTYGPVTAVDCNDGIAGPMQVNQTNGHVFAIHTAYKNPASCTNATDAVVVNKSVDGGVTWTKSVVYAPAALTSSCANDVTVGQDFAVLTIDKSGGLYAVWSQAPVDTAGNLTGPSHIYYSYSADEGAHWTPEQQVDSGVSTNVDVFPWIVAGDAGRIDVVWYGTKQAKSVWDPGSQTTDWYPYLTQSVNANRSATKNAIFSAPVKVSQRPNHNGGICTMGLGCTTGGDRSLVDFFQVDVNKSGGAEVIWADTSNNAGNNGNQSAIVEVAQQSSGPGLFKSSAVSGFPPITCVAATSTPCQSDPTGDAKYEAQGTIGTNVSNLDITGSSVGVDPSSSKNLLVRMNVASLKSLPSAGQAGLNANDLYVDYLTSWNYHKPAGTQATYDSTGNVYYAYLEINTATGATTAAAGNTCAIATTHGKYLVYPGDVAVNSKINQATGTIDLSVPLSVVGNPAVGSTLQSVTAHTVGQPGPAAGPSGPPSCQRDPNGNAQDPNGQIFDVYDKSRAYNAHLTPFVALNITGSGHQSGRSVTFKWRVVSGPPISSFAVYGIGPGHPGNRLGSTVRAHNSRTYSLQVNNVRWDVDAFYLLVKTRAGATVRTPNFRVSG